MTDSFYTDHELLNLRFKKIGKGVKISRKASFYGIKDIIIGDNVRIDDFCILSGNITLGNHIHISAYVALYGRYGIELMDYSGLSPRVTIFSATDDFSGNYLIGPVHPEEMTNVTGGHVLLEKYTHIGAGSIIMPGVTIKTGTVVGAMSFVKSSLMEWSIYAGIPAKKIRDRERNILNIIHS